MKKFMVIAISLLFVFSVVSSAVASNQMRTYLRKRCVLFKEDAEVFEKISCEIVGITKDRKGRIASIRTRWSGDIKAPADRAFDCRTLCEKIEGRRPRACAIRYATKASKTHALAGNWVSFVCM